MNLRYLISGDHSIVLELGNEISEDINHELHQLTLAINKAKIHGIIELIPTYRSLKIDYDPCKIKYNALIKKLDKLQENISSVQVQRVKVIEIPVLYRGPDLKHVSAYNNLSIDEVIQIHSSKEYLIYMLGFTPGFPYLGGMNDKIATPRLETPRSKIQAGSVGIAGNQTGIYPIESPGGWQIIGQTPLRIFDYNKEEPFLFEAGNYLKFVSIDQKTFDSTKKAILEKRYQVKSYLKDVN